MQPVKRETQHVGGWVFISMLVVAVLDALSRGLNMSTCKFFVIVLLDMILLGNQLVHVSSCLDVALLVFQQSWQPRLKPIV